MSSQSTPSLLLDLPAELRLKIYDAVLDLPLDCKVVRHRPGRKPHPYQTSKSMTIANELQYYVHASANTTYKLEVNNLERRNSLVNEVTWREIPCPPSSARTLQATLVFDSSTRFWGNGGPNPILSQLYQARAAVAGSASCDEQAEGFLEKFGIYRNYARKLGFEETPHYRFL
ncbi:hypothetical protein K438DRAFT_1973162 [Mycena galopus ATCC 62051]|nr:hypothetical protein K438DRAFT_1973162 [Mycena galopus ATCC 62051]